MKKRYILILILIVGSIFLYSTLPPVSINNIKSIYGRDPNQEELDKLAKYNVMLYLKRNLNDPDSYEEIEWTNVLKSSDKTKVYSIAHSYRAKNGFGAKTIAQEIFWFDSTMELIDTYSLKEK